MEETTTQSEQENITHIFVYGTLMRKHNEQGILHHGGAEYVTEGSIKGTMYDLGPFPAIKLEGEGRIHGEVHRLPEDGELLHHLDAYEGYNSNFPESSLYTRKEVVVEGFGRAWVYEIVSPRGEVVESGMWSRQEGPFLKQEDDESASTRVFSQEVLTALEAVGEGVDLMEDPSTGEIYVDAYECDPMSISSLKKLIEALEAEPAEVRVDEGNCPQCGRSVCVGCSLEEEKR